MNQEGSPIYNFYFKKYIYSSILFLFTYFFAVLILHCCVQAFSCCREWTFHCDGFSYCGAQALGCLGFSSCSFRALEHNLNSYGTQAQLPHDMWDLPGSGIEPVSPALQGRFLTAVPPGKPSLPILTLTSDFHK